MPGKPETEQIQFQSSIYSQPWWRGVAENASKSSSSVDQQDGSVMNGVTVAQSGTGEGPADGVDSNKQRQPMVSPSLSGIDNSGGDVTEENENIKHGLSSIPFTMGTLGPNSEMELVGHSIVLTSHPYFDAQYGGILTTYGQQTMTNPQLYGMHRARMPLPLEMEEEPVYVNAKQYHGILRRRQSRAKAELEKKVIKVRKPYLHESRHLHAMRRARGNGGRFLNTKKLEGNNPNATTEEGNNNNNNGSNPSAVSGSKLASARLHTDNALQDLTIGYLDGNGLSSLYHSPSNGRNEGHCFGGERHGAPNGGY